ncbi:glutaredoxin family protein [Cohnella cellulosilytica]|uniref:Glutaredoxin family protein n=1 Tax=Cohnella cellulosilytica TaxID=986710 RepID=A0ABW2FJ60_9BACL
MVTLYVSWECEACREAIAYFGRKNIPAHILNVRASRHFMERMISKGGIATPFITIGDQVLHSFDVERIERLLEGEA